jgi:hypothetical protein
VQFNLDERPPEASLEPTADAVMLRVEISPIARGRFGHIVDRLLQGLQRQ